MSSDYLKTGLRTIATRDAERMQDRAMSRGGDLPDYLIQSETMERVKTLCTDKGYSKADVLEAVKDSGVRFVSLEPFGHYRFDVSPPPSKAEIVAKACEIGDDVRPPLPPAADPQLVGYKSEKIYTERYADWINLIKAD